MEAATLTLEEAGSVLEHAHGPDHPEVIALRDQLAALIEGGRWGLLGVVFSPFLHATFSHLFLNAVVLFALCLCLLVLHASYFYVVTVTVIVMGGLLTWIFGRQSVHIGASGLVMGLWSYVLCNAYVRPSLLAIIVVAVCLYYFSGLFMNLFPTDKGVSWEAHVFGFLAGIAAVFLTPIVAVWLSLGV